MSQGISRLTYPGCVCVRIIRTKKRKRLVSDGKKTFFVNEKKILCLISFCVQLRDFQSINRLVFKENNSLRVFSKVAFKEKRDFRR